MCDKVQGYSNHETWTLGLEIDNDRMLQGHCNHMANQCADAHDLAENMDAFFDGMFAALDIISPFSSLLQSALNSVNWLELATEYFEAA